MGGDARFEQPRLLARRCGRRCRWSLPLVVAAGRCRWSAADPRRPSRRRCRREDEQVAAVLVGCPIWTKGLGRPDWTRASLDRLAARAYSRPPMVAAVAEEALDAILGVQLTIAWAGEGRCSPRRLGWWETDLIDEAGGGDFFARLLPHRVRRLIPPAATTSRLPLSANMTTHSRRRSSRRSSTGPTSPSPSAASRTRAPTAATSSIGTTTTITTPASASSRPPTSTTASPTPVATHAPRSSLPLTPRTPSDSRTASRSPPLSPPLPGSTSPSPAYPVRGR